LLYLTACSVPAVTPPLTAAQIVDHAQHAPLKSAAFSGPMTVSLGGVVVSGRVAGQETTSPDRRIAAVTVTRGTLSLIYTQLDAGSKTYVKSPPGDSWSTSARQHPFGTLSYGTLQQPVLLGRDTLDGVATYHIQGQATNDHGNTYQVEYWFRQSDFYPVKSVLDSPDGVVVSSTLTFSDWDSAMEIPLPATGA
jgi:hypothetical protein